MERTNDSTELGLLTVIIPDPEYFDGDKRREIHGRTPAELARDARSWIAVSGYGASAIGSTFNVYRDGARVGTLMFNGKFRWAEPEYGENVDRRVRFYFGDDPTFDGMHDGSTWNGFENVRVTGETLAAITAQFVADGHDEESVAELNTIEPDADGLYDLGNCYATVIDDDETDRLYGDA